jgi:hypothetical protein
MLLAIEPKPIDDTDDETECTEDEALAWITWANEELGVKLTEEED